MADVAPDADARKAPRRVVTVLDLGTVDYEQALEIQERELAAVRDGGQEKLLLLEHPSVYTIGRGGDEGNLRGAPEALGIPVFRVSRGGDATWHGPGQLVGYPILRLEGRERDVRGYLRRLEEVLIRTLRAFGLVALREPGRTGVWVRGDEGSRKIASLGVGIRRWTTFHGFALNVSPDPEPFRRIVPCALDGVQMTSMAAEMGRPVDADVVRNRVIAEFRDVFGREIEGTGTGKTPRRERRWTNRNGSTPDGRKPPWLRTRLPGGPAYQRTRQTLAARGLHTVCQEAFCPNLAECWGHSTATFLLMGDTCTRSCGFCAVRHGGPLPLDPREPDRVADAAEALGLRHVVVTSVNRDDLEDGGATHFAATARAIKARVPGCAVEVLIPDFQGDPEAVRIVVDSPVDVLNHNTETVPRLYARVRPGARYERSLELLARARSLRPELVTKSGLMVGLGESEDELVQVFRDLRSVDCNVLTVGQYLRPSPGHLAVERWVPPAEFDRYRERALGLGFRHVESGPFVRSSYHAWKHVEGAHADAATPEA